jgi:hypothetical protein
VIADLTTTNGNTLYELGLAHIIGHEAILLTQILEPVLLDLCGPRHIAYKQSAAGVQKLERELNGALRSTLSTKHVVQSVARFWHLCLRGGKSRCYMYT